MKILEIRPRKNERALKALFDLELDNNLIIRDLRIIQPPGSPAFVTGPQCSWKNELGQLKFRTLITFPPCLKAEIDLLALSSWKREMEIKQNGQLERQN